jgi:hypothetical protein
VAGHTSRDVADDKISELRAVIREGNQLLGDLKRERRACEELFKTLIPATVNAKIEHEVEAGLAAFYEAQQGARDEAVDRITKSFDELADTLLNGTKTQRRQGDLSIPEIVEKRANESQDHP